MFRYDFELGDVSDVPRHNESSSLRRNVNGDFIANHIIRTWPVSYDTVDLTSLSTIRVQVHQWITEHHLSEAPGGEGLDDIREGGILHANPADVEGKGD